MHVLPPPPFPPGIPQSSANFGHWAGSTSSTWEFTDPVWIPGYSGASLWGWNDLDQYWLNLWRDGTDDGEHAPYGFGLSFRSVSAVVNAAVRHTGADPLTTIRALGLHPPVQARKQPSADTGLRSVPGAAMADDWLHGRATTTPATRYPWPLGMSPSLDAIVAEWAFNEGKIYNGDTNATTSGIDMVLADQFHWRPVPPLRVPRT
jgi:hypothetical protein